MKKTLVAAAVLAAAAAVGAAQVTMYGLVDYGFAYQRTDADVAGQSAGDTFRMITGMNSGSRFGLRGTEEIGSGMTVGFVLENGFNADDGTLDNNTRLFGRESQAYVKGSYGTLAFGRMGQLASANGTYALLPDVSPFSSNWGDSLGLRYVTAYGWNRFDNTVAYQSPTVHGLQLHVQYSFQNDAKGFGREGRSETERYYGAAVTYTAPDLYLVAIADSINHGRYLRGAKENGEFGYENDQWTYTLAGRYELSCGVKLYGMAQYFRHAMAVGNATIENTGFGPYGYDYSRIPGAGGADGFGLALGVGIPAFGGTAKLHAGYLDAEASDKAADASALPADRAMNRWNVAAGYDYSITKRTQVYGAVSYLRDDVSEFREGGSKASSVEVMAGLIHTF